MMKLPRIILIAVAALVALVPASAQVDTVPQSGSTPTASDQGSPQQTFDHPEDRMQTPPPVTGQNYPTAFASAERANYLRYGVAFTSAYTDNAEAGISTHPISDISYSVAPTIAIDENTSRMHLVGTYAPGFTFYQRLSSLNESDENASLNFSYRLSPHLTFSAHDGFQKTSNVFN